MDHDEERTNIDLNAPLSPVGRSPHPEDWKSRRERGREGIEHKFGSDKTVGSCFFYLSLSQVFKLKASWVKEKKILYPSRSLRIFGITDCLYYNLTASALRQTPTYQVGH